MPKLTKQPHKKCPCCDGLAKAVITDIRGIPLKLPLKSYEEDPMLSTWYIIKCCKCGIQTPPVLFEQEAWKIWNKRIDEEV